MLDAGEAAEQLPGGAEGGGELAGWFGVAVAEGGLPAVEVELAGAGGVGVAEVKGGDAADAAEDEGEAEGVGGGAALAADDELGVVAVDGGEELVAAGVVGEPAEVAGDAFVAVAEDLGDGVVVGGHGQVSRSRPRQRRRASSPSSETAAKRSRPRRVQAKMAANRSAVLSWPELWTMR